MVFQSLLLVSLSVIRSCLYVSYLPNLDLVLDIFSMFIEIYLSIRYIYGFQSLLLEVGIWLWLVSFRWRF